MNTNPCLEILLPTNYPIRTLYYTNSKFRDTVVLKKFNLKSQTEKSSFAYTSLNSEMVPQEDWYDELSSFLVRSDSAIVHHSNKSVVFGMVNVEKGDIFWLYDEDVGVDPDMQNIKADRELKEEREANFNKIYFSLVRNSASDCLMDGEVRG